MNYFDHKTIWITGASSGLGRALARALSSCPARLILSARRVDRLEALKEELADRPATVEIVPLDLERFDDIESKAAGVQEAYGPVDILINNAGISLRSTVRDMRFDVVKRIMDVNFLGTVALTRKVLDTMFERKSGHIVVISSIMGKYGTPLRSAYCASKFALFGFFESFSAEAWRDNIDVTIVSPGWIRTEITQNALEGDGRLHGTLDPGQAKAREPEVYAPRILKAIAKKKSEYYIAVNWKPGLGLFLKRFFPRILRFSVRKLNVI